MYAGLTGSPMYSMASLYTVSGDTVNRLFPDGFVYGHLRGHVRSYYMATINHKSLRDYQTQAIGANLVFRTATWRGWYAQVGGRATRKLWSNGLNGIDPLTGKAAKWESELYDITDRNNKTALYRIDELMLGYRRRKWHIRIGRQAFKTPLMNPSDGRMFPYHFSGLRVRFTPSGRLSAEGAWIYKVAPRATTRWYTLENAIGLSGNGFATNGEKARYTGHVTTRGLLYLHGTYKYLPTTTVQYWHYSLENQFHTAISEVKYQVKQWFAGLQYLLQAGTGRRSGLSPEQQYYEKGPPAHILAMQAGISRKWGKLSIRFMKGLGKGRLVFPREMGRERLFASQPRHWKEGQARSTTVLLHWEKMFRSSWHILVSGGYNHVADGPAHRYNKYGLVSHPQLNLDVRRTLANEKLQLHFLYVWSGAPATDVSPSVLPYRYQYHHFNLIANLFF